MDNHEHALRQALTNLQLPGHIMSGVCGGCEELSPDNSIRSVSAVNGDVLAEISIGGQKEADLLVGRSLAAFEQWKRIPMPRRGELVRQMGMAIREHKEALATLITFEMGKLHKESLGEVQEIIDICDYALGLSRQMGGETLPSERPGHRMMEQYHPLGPVAVITAFNFPMAVWGWNAMLALVCGDSVIWKPSEKTTLCAVALHRLCSQVAASFGAPNDLLCLLAGTGEAGAALAAHPGVALVSATGSTTMGKKVSAAVAARLGRSLLELGGNNAVIISEKARLPLALQAVVFGAVGTAGQRCTTTRRVIVHQQVLPVFLEKIKEIYGKLKVGHPMDADTHLGPLIDSHAEAAYLQALQDAEAAGGKWVVKGEKLSAPLQGAYVTPSVIVAENTWPIVQKETFAPLLYVIPYSQGIEEAVALNNEVPQGLSSSLFSDDIREVEYYLSTVGSDCGLANINIGTSGAEIGLAFGGEKETGGGRESGSDAWKNYMRRMGTTLNYSNDLPLAQGIDFQL